MISKPVSRQWGQYADTGLVYFVGWGNLVKVGTTKRTMAERLKDLQAMSPVKLDVLLTIPGGKSTEHLLHTYFSAERHHGEWFHRFGERMAMFLASGGVITDEIFDEALRLKLKSKRA